VKKSVKDAEQKYRTQPEDRAGEKVSPPTAVLGGDRKKNTEKPLANPPGGPARYRRKVLGRISRRGRREASWEARPTFRVLSKRIREERRDQWGGGGGGGGGDCGGELERGTKKSYTAPKQKKVP